MGMGREPGEPGDGREKRYVAVEYHCSETGAVTPKAVIWRDGRRFVVDRVVGMRLFSPADLHGGRRYIVKVGPELTNLYYEVPRWFVHEKRA